MYNSLTRLVVVGMGAAAAAAAAAGPLPTTVLVSLLLFVSAAACIALYHSVHCCHPLARTVWRFLSY